MSHQNKIDSWKQGGWHPSIEVYYLAYHIRNPGDSTLPDLPYPACNGRDFHFPHAHNDSLVRERIDLLLELAIDGRDGGAPDSRAVQVLERDEEGVDARLLLGLRVASGEGDGDGRVVDRMASRDVRVQGLGERCVSL